MANGEASYEYTGCVATSRNSWSSLKEPEMATLPAIFKQRQTESVLILSAVRWCLRYSLSLRDVEELLKERGLEAHHTTVWR